MHEHTDEEQLLQPKGLLEPWGGECPTTKDEEYVRCRACACPTNLLARDLQDRLKEGSHEQLQST